MATKKNTTIKQLLLVLAGVLVLVAILFAPKALSDSSVSGGLGTEEHHTEDGHNHEHEHEHEHEHSSSNSSENDLLAIAKQELDSVTKSTFNQLELKANKIEDIETKLSLYDSLIGLSIQKNKPPLVAKYSEEKAKAVPTENNWLLAGDNYFKAFRLSKNQSKSLIKGAVSSYEKVLALNSANLKAQTALGVAYVEGASVLGVMPMKGIGMLKEVLNSDPKNVDALTNLGYFAIQSGQYEKAIERFNTVLAIDSLNAEAYIYLTDVYLSQNQVQEGIKTLEKYKSLVNDPLAKQQVDEYIEELRSK